MTNVVPLVDIDSKDKQMYRDCLAGISVRTIAKRYSVTEAEALAAMDRCLTPLDLQMRLHTLQLELDRLDEMESIFHASMLKGDHASAHLMIRLKELRADYVGLRAPLWIDPTQLQVKEVNTTDKIQRVLDDLVAHKALAKPEDDPASDEG
jgi:hypothetical protein